MYVYITYIYDLVFKVKKNSYICKKSEQKNF